MEIFQKTPVWVWVLFGLLIVLGYAQTKERTLSFTRALIIPLVMFFLSLQGVISLFGPGLGIVAWALGMGLLSKMTLGYKVVQSVTYEPQKKLFIIQGGWVWFWVIMGIFWLKYILSVISNVAAGLLSIPWVFLSASFCLGGLSGFFLARVIAMRRAFVNAQPIHPKNK